MICYVTVTKCSQLSSMIQFGIVVEVTNYEAKWTRVNLDSNALYKIRIIIDSIDSTSLGCYEVCQQMFSIWGTEGGETLFKWTVCKPRKQPPAETESVLRWNKVETTFHRESSQPGFWLFYFYANEESKSHSSDWSK